MKLKPQSSAKELLENSLEQLRQERSALSLEITSLLKSRNALQCEIQAEGEALFSGLRKTEQECLGKKETLRNEIASLEERRKSLLVPLDARKAKLDEREAAIKSYETALDKKHHEILSLQSLLAQKNEQVSDRNALLDEREQEIERKERKIQASLDFHVKSAEALADKWQVFREYEAKKTLALDERVKSLDFQEAEVEKTKIFNEKQKEELQNLRTDVDSRRLLLAQALKEKERYAS